MEKRVNCLNVQFVFVASVLFFVFNVSSGLAGNDWDDPFDLPKEIPGNYEGKWYGVYCTNVPRTNMLGVRSGEAYPDQKIINSWGYKAKPIGEIKELLPSAFYDVCSNPQDWGDIRINETAYIPLDEWPGEHQKVRREYSKKYQFRNIKGNHVSRS